MSEALLEVRGGVKRYGGVLANADVNLTVRAGEIHALMGENGAGKSTLVNILYGITRPDAGEVRWRGAPFLARNPAQARGMGIGVVFQKFSLFEPLTVWENLRLAVALSDDALEGELTRLDERYGLRVAARRRVDELSAGERQRVEIVRCLLQKPTLLIMDEPTSVLTPAEVGRLFELLRSLAADGCAVLFISHKLKEIAAVCGRATVLRRGRTVAQVEVSAVTDEELVGLMLGGASAGAAPARRDGAAADGETRLELRDVREGGVRVPSLALKRGCVTGVAGIAGNGQEALVRYVSGETTGRPESVRWEGEAIGGWGVARRARVGILSVPTDRYRTAAVGALSLAENGLLGCMAPERLAPRGFLRRARLRAFAESVAREFDVKVEAGRGAETLAAALSGGNLQKFVVGRAVLQQPAVLVAANPTWGVDVASARFIRRRLRGIADAGAAVLVASEDLDELFEVADEIAVINRGALSAPMAMRESLTAMEVGALMAGEGG